MQLKYDRPIFSQIGVRAIEKPERSDHQRCTQPRSKNWKPVIRKREQGGEQIENGKKQAAHADKDEQSLFHCVQPADHLLFDSGAPLKDATDSHIDDKANEENNVR